MKKNEISTLIVIEKRKINKEGLVPVKLRLTYLRKQVFYSIRNTKGASIWLSEADFNKINGQRVPSELKEMKNYLNEVIVNADKIIKKKFADVNTFSFDKFRELFFDTDNQEQTTDLFHLLNKKANQLKKDGRISTSLAYEYAMHSLKKFTGKEKLPIEKINVSFLNEYEKWFLSSGKSITSVGIYLRNVRAIFNECISKGMISNAVYPFGIGKYEIPTGRNIKKALTIEDIKKVIDFKLETRQRNYYKDLWVFSYFCNGINIKDVALLKQKNIVEDVIYIERAKTIKKNRTKPKTIEIVINKYIGKIIDDYSPKNNIYVFDIINESMNEIERYNAVKQMVKNINKVMKEISDLLELPKITTYTARHSFATILKRSGASVEFISESLGHKNLNTTENYLSNFELETKRHWSSKLIPE